jgi:hypothetical protein
MAVRKRVAGERVFRLQENGARRLEREAGNVSMET